MEIRNSFISGMCAYIRAVLPSCKAKEVHGAVEIRRDRERLTTSQWFRTAPRVSNSFAISMKLWSTAHCNAVFPVLANINGEARKVSSSTISLPHRLAWWVNRIKSSALQSSSAMGAVVRAKCSRYPGRGHQLRGQAAALQIPSPQSQMPWKGQCHHPTLEETDRHDQYLCTYYMLL